MNEVMRRYWPPETQITLLAAALAAPEPAAAAWRSWLATRDLDTASWPEVRLLAALAPRIAELDPESPLAPRLRGISRFVWTRTQIALTGGKPLLARLHGAGIPLLLLKGSARLAEDPASAAKRLVRDIDVLVPKADWPRALEIADTDGWRPVQDWPYGGRLEADTARRIFPTHHSVGYRLGEAEVDIHHAALFMCRNDGDEDALWRRARPARLHGIPVHVPSPADALLLNLVHGMLHGAEPVADWAIDAAALIGAGDIDWDILVQEAEARCVEPFALSALMLLAERLGQPSPGAVLARLRRGVREPFISDFVHFATGYYPEHPALIDAVRHAAVQRAERAPYVAPAIGATSVLDTRVDATAWPLTFGLPEALPDGMLRLVLEVTPGHGFPRGGATLAFTAPGMVLFHWHCRRRVLGASRLALDIPAALFRARRIDRVVLDAEGEDPELRAAIAGARLRIHCRTGAKLRRPARGIVPRPRTLSPSAP
jgi:hypothetical protein